MSIQILFWTLRLEYLRQDSLKSTLSINEKNYTEFTDIFFIQAFESYFGEISQNHVK